MPSLRPLFSITMLCFAGMNLSPAIGTPASSGQPRTVQVAETTQVSAQRQLKFSGVIRPANRATVAFTVGGRLAQRFVQTGAQVRKGQRLASLDTQGFEHHQRAAQARVDELKARVRQSQRDTRRLQDLVSKKAATQEELEQVGTAGDAVKANLAAAEAQLAEANRQLKETSLHAAYDGVVTEVFAEPGEFLGPGQALLSISGQDRLEVEVEVPSSVLTKLRQGTPVTLDLPLAGQHQAKGSVQSIGYAALRPGQLFPVIVALQPSKGIIPGMTAELLLELEEDALLAVPVGAVINPSGSHPSVFRVRDGRVERLAVRIGRLTGDRVTLDSDLELGDWVVISGHAGLLEGEQVEVAQ